MELHPILEQDTSPNPGLWYVMSAVGDCPSVRVGHTCTYVPGPDGSGGKVVIIGGANPSGPFAETYILDLDSFAWDTVDHPGFKARYEHAAFMSASDASKIYVFGGADQGGNHNDIQVLDVTTKTWSTVTPGGTPPSPRTFHTAACIGDTFYVYSGGQCGSDPVGDRQVHSYNTKTNTWSVENIRGNPPKPRHGHVMVAAGNKIIIHGGMSGTAFYDDLHVLNLETHSWTAIKQKRGHPCGRAAHAATVHDGFLYICGGMNRDGALDDTHKLDLSSFKWSKVELDGPPPASRLDFAMCHVRLKVPVMPTDITEEMNASRSQARDVLEQQLRLGSAGSVRSVGSLGSAGSQRSITSLGSAGSYQDQLGAVAMAVTGVHRSPSTEDAGKDQTVGSSPEASPIHQPSSLSDAAAVEVEESATGGATSTEHKLVDMCLVFGGMDTEGEIYDDCLLMVLGNDVQHTKE